MTKKFFYVKYRLISFDKGNFTTNSVKLPLSM